MVTFHMFTEGLQSGQEYEYSNVFDCDGHSQSKLQSLLSIVKCRLEPELKEPMDFYFSTVKTQ